MNENCLRVLVVTKTAKVSVSGVGLGLDPAGLGLGLGAGLGLGLGLGLSGLGLVLVSDSLVLITSLALLQPARSVCVSLSAVFIHFAKAPRADPKILLLSQSADFDRRSVSALPPLE